MGRITPIATRKRYFRLRAEGSTISEAAREVRISRTTAYAIERDGRGENSPGNDGRSLTEARLFYARTEENNLCEPILVEHLSEAATKALADFDYFRRRYFGRLATPWQTDAAVRAVAWLESPHKEYVVVNCPPGSGKSTLWHDAICWMIARDRTLRVLYGSRTERQASAYVNRIRRSLERIAPLKAPEKLLSRGMATDAAATMAADFGRFKPLAHEELWRREMFVVAQSDATQIEDKEATVSAYGMDSGFLGGRFDLVIWDDLVDKVSMRTSESREALANWFDGEAESRLEPGGLMVLQGQRMGADDLYRHALDETVPDDEDDLDDEEPAPSGGEAKYAHICYRAHYEDRCEGVHRASLAKAYPDGCLLDPMRLPWRDLRPLAHNRVERYKVMYQQEDVDPASVLVQKIWLDGGRDEDGYEWPGCWDNERGLAELPEGLSGDLLSIATADPSPTKFWAIQWWVYHVPTEQRFLMDLIRTSMQASEFLDWSYHADAFVGIMEEWQQRSTELGWPIQTWIVEANAAQRFLLQYEHTHRWQRRWGVDIIGHQTNRNKSDPEMGPQILGPLYKWGKVRLPGNKNKMGARIASLKLVDEVTRFPESTTDDCVMAQWFLEFNLHNIHKRADAVPLMWRPRWMRGPINRRIA